MKLCTNCKYEDTDMNEWPCDMCDDNGYGLSKLSLIVHHLIMTL